MISATEFEKVWNEFCDFYRKHGGKGINELWGGYFREESDIVFHLARLCTNKFGLGYVHIDSPVDTMFFSNFPSAEEKQKRRYHIDLDITDPQAFASKDKKHGIFIEVKWIYKDIKQQPYGGARLKRRVNGIEKDLEKLNHNLKNGRCENAFMCIVDDEKIIKEEELSNWKTKYPNVNILLCQPINA
ncbi:MAG: hypothetical protein QXQ61_02255 [Candidatus Bathyarchaeia archaeon]